MVGVCAGIVWKEGLCYTFFLRHVRSTRRIAALVTNTKYI